MNREQILAMVDHTLLAQTATWEEIKVLCDDAMHYHTASVCIPPCYVRQAKDYVGDRMKVCTVIGFPNGNHASRAKAAEAQIALEDGADELDMVINIGLLKAGNLEAVKEEIRTLKEITGDRVLKVIIETCLLTEEEKVTMCRLVTEAGADFIKTSTGFSKAGATPEDIRLFAANVGEKVVIKAAGGIRSFEDAQSFISLGATRLGTSRLVALAKKEA